MGKKHKVSYLQYSWLHNVMIINEKIKGAIDSIIHVIHEGFILRRWRGGNDTFTGNLYSKRETGRSKVATYM